MRRLSAALLLAALLLTACSRAPQLHQREAYVFGTRVEVSVWGESAEKSQQALAAVLALPGLLPGCEAAAGAGRDMAALLIGGNQFA